MPKQRQTLRHLVPEQNKLRNSLDTVWDKANDLHWAQKGATTQGKEHCARVEENLFRLLNDWGVIKNCTPTVAFLLSAAAALHDVGKIATAASAHETQDHGQAGHDRIHAIRDKIDWPDPEFLHIVADIVRVHARVPLSKIKEGSRRCLDSIVWPRSLAALFRLADILDLTSARTPETYCAIRGELFEKNRSVWLARGSCTAWDREKDDPSVIVIQARPDSPEAARAVLKLIQLTNRELNKAHRKELERIRFGDGGSAIRFPTQVVLKRDDAAVVKRLARKAILGYAITDREIFIREKSGRIRIEERLHVLSLGQKNRLEVRLAGLADNLDRVVWQGTEVPAADYEFNQRTLLLRRRSLAQETAKLEMYYHIKPTSTSTVTYELEISSKGAPHNSITFTFDGEAATFSELRGIDINKDRSRNPTSAERNDISPGQIEFRIQEAITTRTYFLTW